MKFIQFYPKVKFCAKLFDFLSILLGQFGSQMLKESTKGVPTGVKTWRKF
jgi:hypothetical protein